MQCNYKFRRERGGFSLIEMLAVMALMSVMIAMMMPLLSGFTGTAGRRGAVNSLMNTFEQARVAAVEAGAKVYVVMRRNPNLGEQDSFIVVRERSEGLGEASTAPYIVLTRWQKLPRGILFFQAASSLTQTGVDLPVDLMGAIPGGVPSGELFGLGFNRNGQVSFPSSGALSLFLAEGARKDSTTTASANGASATITERLSLRRFTGRAQLDYTAPSS